MFVKIYGALYIITKFLYFKLTSFLQCSSPPTDYLPRCFVDFLPSPALLTVVVMFPATVVFTVLFKCRMIVRTADQQSPAQKPPPHQPTIQLSLAQQPSVQLSLAHQHPPQLPVVEQPSAQLPMVEQPSPQAGGITPMVYMHTARLSNQLWGFCLCLSLSLTPPNIEILPEHSFFTLLVWFLHS